MIKLKDSVDIAVPLDSLYTWLQDLEKNFVLWSPSHEYFRKVSGGFDVGDTIQFKELVRGVSYDIKGVIKQHEKNENGFQIIFETMSGLGHIFFIGEETSEGCCLIHIEEFGKPDTFFGKIFNWFIFNVFAKRRADGQLIKDDMAIDNLYLKKLLESDLSPAKKR